AHVDRQDPELLQKVKQAILGGKRQGDDQEVHALGAAKLHKIVEPAEPRMVGDARWRPTIVTIVEETENLDRTGRSPVQLLQQFGDVAADHNGATRQTPFARPALDKGRNDNTSDGAERQRSEVPSQQFSAFVV